MIVVVRMEEHCQLGRPKEWLHYVQEVQDIGTGEKRRSALSIHWHDGGSVASDCLSHSRQARATAHLHLTSPPPTHDQHVALTGGLTD
jgi:hypothetical protein